MNKVTLNEAWDIYKKRLNNFNKKNAYKSFMVKRHVEDRKNLYEIRQLYADIINAEKLVGIDLLKAHLTNLELESNFYTTKNSDIYPVDHISREDRDYIIEKYALVKSDIDWYKEEIYNRGKNIYVEI